MTKTVNKENLRNALIKYYNDYYKDRFNDTDRGILVRRLTNFIFIGLKSKSYSILPCNNDTIITKIEDDCYEVEGSFAKDYIK